MSILKKLSDAKCKELFEALYFMKVKELEDLCEHLQIPIDGPKGEIIERIKHFVNTGERMPITPLPEISRAQKNKEYPLQPGTLILFDSYKNDAKTRAFFKKLIGNHFHFTSFGIDWINARWKAGNPPTYQEFAHMWQKEVDRRKNTPPAEPKKEWAYINFLQQYSIEHPTATAAQARIAWKKERDAKVQQVMEILKN